MKSYESMIRTISRQKNVESKKFNLVLWSSSPRI